MYVDAARVCGGIMGYVGHVKVALESSHGVCFLCGATGGAWLAWRSLPLSLSRTVRVGERVCVWGG